MKLWTWDCETDNLLYNLTKMWCAVFKAMDEDEWIIFTDYEKLPQTFKEAFEDDIQVTWMHKEALAGWLLEADIGGLICHNLLGYDLEVLRRLYGIPYTVGKDSLNGRPMEFIDTYVWSTRLNPNRQLPFGCPQFIEVVGSRKRRKIGAHGLEGWGFRCGVAKPSVQDWSEQPLQVYVNRCIEDVKINEATYKMLLEEKERLGV